jgi:hypothetical protein
VRGLRERAERLHRETDFAIVLNLESATLGVSQRIRGFTELLEDLLIDRTFAAALLERVTEIACRIADAAVRKVGDLVDAVTTADDLGFQTQPYRHPDLHRSASSWGACRSGRRQSAARRSTRTGPCGRSGALAHTLREESSFLK